MRYLAIVMSLLISLPAPVQLYAQDTQAAAPRLNLVVVEGEGAINNIRLRSAREPIVQVEDENHKPVAGAAVVFTLPSQGASGTFANSGQTFTTVTNQQGQAIGRGLHPNSVQGQMQIRVTASSNGRTASVTITQTNMLAAAGAAAAAGGISAKLIAIIAVAGAAVAGGVAYGVTRGGGNNNGAVVVTPPITITPGSGTVGPPR